MALRPQNAAFDINAAPDFAAEVVTDSILVIAKIKGPVKSLLDIDRLLGETSIQSVTANL